MTGEPGACWRRGGVDAALKEGSTCHKAPVPQEKVDITVPDKRLMKVFVIEHPPGAHFNLPLQREY